MPNPWKRIIPQWFSLYRSRLCLSFSGKLCCQFEAGTTGKIVEEYGEYGAGECGNLSWQQSLWILWWLFVLVRAAVWPFWHKTTIFIPFKDFTIRSYISNSKERHYGFMSISMEGEPLGQLVFELLKTLCTRTFANCKALCTLCTGEGEWCTGVFLSYCKAVIQRIVASGWIQRGDIHGRSGTGGSSIYGGTFEDECFALKHDTSGIFGMAIKGPNTNSSEFYVTLKAAP